MRIQQLWDKLYIKRRLHRLRVSFILRHARRGKHWAQWRNMWNIATSRVPATDSRSFIYLLYLSLHAIVFQIYWSRVVVSQTPPRRLVFADRRERSRNVRTCVIHRESSSRRNTPENENEFPPSGRGKANVTRDRGRAPFSRVGGNKLCRKSRDLLVAILIDFN